MNRESTQQLRERLLRNPEVQHMIRVRAYEIYERRGKVPGRDAENWFQAEQEVITFLIQEEQRLAEEVRRAGDTTATVPESAISVVASMGIQPATAEPASEATGQTAEEQVESQSALVTGEAAEPQAEAPAPKKTRARSSSGSTASRKSKAAQTEGTEAAPKKTARRASPKKAGEATRTRASKKPSKTEESA